MKSSRRKQTNPNRVSSGALEPEKGIDLSSTQAKPDAAMSPKDSSDHESASQGMDSNNSMHSDDSPPPPPPRPNSGGEYDFPLDMHVAVFPCSNCSETFSNAHDLREHKMDTHGPDVKRIRKDPEDGSDDFPTAYHRLGRELHGSAELSLPNGHEKPKESPPLPRYSDSPSHSSHAPSLHQQSGKPVSDSRPEDGRSPRARTPEIGLAPPRYNKEGSNGNGDSSWNGNGKQERIFHMDAYCDLCDREFCNKYFLKTHKANKHGIYEDSSPPAGNVPLPMHGMMGIPDQNSPFNFKMDGMKPPPPSDEPLMPWSFKLDPSAPPAIPSSLTTKRSDTPSSVSGNSHPSKLMDSSLPMFPLPMPNMNMDSSKNKIPGKIDHQGSHISSSLPSETTVSSTSILNSITNSIKAAPPMNDPSMEDYCHICQKHFCNKYYLKKHKQDVHGIAPDTPSPSSIKRSRSNLLDSIPISSANHMMMPQTLAGLTSMPNLHGMPGLPNMPSMPNMPPGVMVINPYSLPPVAIIPAGSLMPGQQLPPPPHPMISQPMGMPPLESPLMVSASAPTSTSTSLSQSPPIKSGGPSQPEAGSNASSGGGGGGVHCNICGKEFCNEFYLQVHKESKHKMMRRATDDCEPPRDKALSLVKDPKREVGKSSPPPLSGGVIKHEPMHLPPMSPMGMREPGRLICYLCNKEFSDPYLFNTHRLQEHGFNEMVDLNHMESGELPDREEAMRNMNQSLARIAADASAVNYASGFGGPKSKSQESVVCDICNKEIANQYFLRVHKLNVHGIDPNTNEKFESRPPSSPISMISHPRTPPTSNSMAMSPPNQQPLNMASINSMNHGKHPMLPFLPPKIDFKDMPPFGDFSRDFKTLRDMSPFMADSINNELFARSQNRRPLDLNFFGFPSLGKLPGEDNVKLNFDPEAYCDICKKEFCSKYFLRTHKQNIHGIKCDLPSASISKPNDFDRLPNPINMPPRPSPLNNSNGKIKESNEKSSWRWKEPVNSSRVICDICNKEVCNKYFLRTHKFKKHGIPPTSPNVSMNGSPVASDCDTASNASSQPDEKPIRLDSMANMPQMIPLPPSDKLSEKFHHKNLGNMKGMNHMNLHHNNNNNNNNEYVETCNMCKRRFKNSKLLKEHIWKHHSVNDTIDPRIKSSPPIYPCQVCGIDFPAELSVQLHLIQEHNARVTLDTEEPQIPTEEPSLPNGEDSHGNSKLFSRQCRIYKKVSHPTRTRKYVCSQCDFSSVWLSSLLDHEKESHGLKTSPASPRYTCKECQRTEPSLHMLSSHLKEVHGWTLQEAHNEIQSRHSTPNGFKCSHCPAVFPSHIRAMLHFRQIHIRARRDVSLKRSYQRNLLQCPSCPFKTHFVSKLRNHIKRHMRNVRRSKQVNNYTPISEAVSSPGSLRLPTTMAVPVDKIVARDGALGRSMATGNAGAYMGIAASLLSSNCSDERRERRSATPNDSQSREDILLQTYTLPMSPAMVDTPSFKMATQNSSQPAVIGL